MNYSVKVNGVQTEVFEETVYTVPYNNTETMECVSFEMNGRAELEITSETEVKSVIVRPLSCGVAAEIENGIIKITIDRPMKLSVEINGSVHGNLAVFAEKDCYKDFCHDGENVIFFKKGVHKKDIFRINKSGTVVYLERGAVLSGKLLIENCENVTVCGYGKISMAGIDRDIMPMERQRALELHNCRNCSVRDIMITDSANWSFRMMGCDGIEADNIKIIGCRGNSDGIDVCGSRNVTVSGIFTRTWDDSFVVKAFDTGDTENVVFRDSVLWNDFARPIEVGVELRADNVRNILFENIDIIHSPTGYPILGIHHGDRAEVRDITFSDIRIEDTPGAQLFDIRITKAVWNRDKKMGDIAGVHFKNISYVGSPGMPYSLSDSRIQGFGPENTVRDVTIENLSILGKYVPDALTGGIQIMDYAHDVKFKCPEENRLQPIITGLDLAEGAHEDGSCTVTVSAENPNAGPWHGNMRLQISPVNTAKHGSLVFDTSLRPSKRLCRDIDVVLQPGKYLLSIQSDSPCVRGDWKFLNLPLKLDSRERRLEFHNYYGDNAGINLSVSDNALVIVSDILKSRDNELVVYCAMPVPEERGQVVFSVEETDFGEAPAVIIGEHGLEPAPQLRCPAEITYVFKNEPKVSEIKRASVCTDSGKAVIPLSELGADGNHFWLEIEARLPEMTGYRYPFTLFHSVKPMDSVHMFADVYISDY
ncbi:MAG: hypothetical protein J6N52_01640 [Clostridia bacterium]|nr:hypothetical protein [Clostridia bacterium]